MNTETIVSAIPDLSMVTVTTFLLFFFKMAIDSFNMTGIEKTILPDSKKLYIYLSQISLFSFIGGIILFIFLYYSDFKTYPFSGLVVVFFASFIIVFFITMIVSIILFSFINYHTVKIEYYIHMKNGNENHEWLIVRRVDKTKLLILRDDRIYKFIDEKSLFESEIIRELVEGKRDQFIPHDKIAKNIKPISWGLSLAIVALLVWLFSLEIKDIKNIMDMLIPGGLLLIAYLLILYASVIYNNEKIRVKLRRKEEATASSPVE